MKNLGPVDVAFLLLENPSRMVHMAAYQVFRLPADQPESFVPRVLDAYRASEVAEPFRRKLRWLGKGAAAWETVTPDMDYHIRHLAVPAPGRMEDFYKLVSFLNTSLLDRSKPLWECYVIEGLPDDQFAVMVKVHHALIDGAGALRYFQNSLNTTAGDRSIRPVWAPIAKPPKRAGSRSDKSRVDKLLQAAAALPSQLLDSGRSLTDLGAQNLRLKPKQASLPFNAKDTLLNRTAQSSERRYANCELPLDRVKAVSKATGTTVNDVVMSLIDDALHAYLKAHDAPATAPLVTMMAMSFRSEEHGSDGNQVSVELVGMGEPDSTPADRLQQLHRSTTAVKAYSSTVPSAVRQLYSVLIFGGGTLPQFAKAFRSIPSANLLISNMIGPREQLYLGGAPLLAFHGLPIVPPGVGLNVTFATIHQDICLGVGAAPEAIEDPYQLIRLIVEALEKLEAAVLPAARKDVAAGPVGSPRKTAARRSASGNRSAATKRKPS